MKYTTKDFSEIHSADTKPTMEGWYVAGHGTNASTHRKGFGGVEPYSSEFWYWREGKWFVHPEHDASYIQNREWFGLRDDPLGTVR